MDDASRPAEGATANGERHAVSLLVRFWREPREASGEISPLRGYIRHLQTGEEQYVTDPQMLVDYVLRQVGEGVPAELAGTN